MSRCVANLQRYTHRDTRHWLSKRTVTQFRACGPSAKQGGAPANSRVNQVLVPQLACEKRQAARMSAQHTSTSKMHGVGKLQDWKRKGQTSRGGPRQCALPALTLTLVQTDCEAPGGSVGSVAVGGEVGAREAPWMEQCCATGRKTCQRAAAPRIPSSHAHGAAPHLQPPARAQ